MLTFHDVLLIDANHQLFDAGIGASHDATHGVEEGNDCDNTDLCAAQWMVVWKCPGGVVGQHLLETFMVTFAIGGKELVDQVKIRMVHDRPPLASDPDRASALFGGITAINNQRAVSTSPSVSAT